MRAEFAQRDAALREAQDTIAQLRGGRRLVDLFSYGVYSYGLYSYGLHSFGLYRVQGTRRPVYVWRIQLWSCIVVAFIVMAYVVMAYTDGRGLVIWVLAVHLWLI